MDFLKIRKKAKERARSGGSPPKAAPASEPDPGSKAGRRGGPAAGQGSTPSPAPAGIGRADPMADAVAASFAETFQDVPAPAPAREGTDPRFTTWRPGTGERPYVGIPDPAPAPASPPPEAAAEDRARLRRPARPAPAPRDLVFTPAEAGPSASAPRPPPRPVASQDPLDEFFFRENEDVPALAALPADAEPADAPGPEDGGVEEYLTFRLGVEEYAVAIERVREVLKSQPITEVPRAPAGVLGVVTVRGEVVAVFDPRRRLGLPGAPPPEGSGRIVIVDDGEGPCGLLVDAVASVVRLARGSIEPCPQGIGGASADCLAGIGRERSRLFTVLELGALLRRAPAPARGGRSAHAGA